MKTTLSVSLLLLFYVTATAGRFGGRFGDRFGGRFGRFGNNYQRFTPKGNNAVGAGKGNYYGVSFSASSSGFNKPEVKYEYVKVEKNGTTASVNVVSSSNGVKNTTEYTYDLKDGDKGGKVEEEPSATLEEPEFTLTEDQPQNGKYEVRQYSQAKYACTILRSPRFFVQGNNMLHSYFKGYNDQGKELATTNPVLIFEEGNRRCTYCPSIFTVCHYIPKADQITAPNPFSVFVSLKMLAPKVIVRNIEGPKDSVKPEIEQLIEDINDEGKHRYYTSNYVYVSKFNSNMKLAPYSEVWLFSA